MFILSHSRITHVGRIGRQPLGCVPLGNVEAQFESVLDREEELVWPRLPHLTLAVGSTPDGCAIGVAFCDMVEGGVAPPFPGLDCDCLGNHCLASLRGLGR